MYLKIINGLPNDYSISQLKRDYPNVSFPSDIPSNILSIFNVFPYTNGDKPEYDINTQKIVRGDFELQGDSWVRVWSVVDLTQAEIQQKEDAAIQQRKTERISPENLISALEILSKKVIETTIDDMDAADVAKMATLFPDYKIGYAYKINDIFNYNGIVLKVVQAHTSQIDWVPSETPALYNAYRPVGSISAWVQPESTNPYMIGEKVIYDGRIYESTIDNNVWSPAAYPAGWTDIGVA